MNFQYFSPTILIVGCGRLNEIGELAGAYGKKAFVVTGRSSTEYNSLKYVLKYLTKANIHAYEFIKPAGEPDYKMTDQAVAEVKKNRCDLVISLGGGAVIDLAKATAGLATNGGSVLDYLEGVGMGKEITRPALPHIAIPTTAGTGAEVTRNAVISSREGKFKKSIRSPYLCPQVAILDAQLTYSLSREHTAHTGMDAITQLIEAFVSKKSNPFTDALALFGMEMAFEAISVTYENPTHLKCREKMLLAATISGLCLANAGLGMAHGFASGLGAFYNVPHGLLCAVLLPHAMRHNCKNIRSKLARIGKFFTADGSETEEHLANIAIETIVHLNEKMNIPSDLHFLNISSEDYEQVVSMSMGNSMAGNPVEITPESALSFLTELAS